MIAPSSPHDLRLPDWGPYTKRYIGVSHLADPARGLRFDLSIFPGFYRRKVEVPNVLWESGYLPWEAAPGLTYFSHRHELDGRDEVYGDVAFAAFDDDARLIRCELVNRSDAPQALVLHQLASLAFPPPRAYTPEPLRPATVTLPPGGRWLDALDYAELRFAIPRPTDTLGYDGLRRAEVRDHGFVGGGGVGQGFGAEAGDTVVYDLPVDRARGDALLLMRYRAAEGAGGRFDVTFDSAPLAELPLVGTGDFAVASLPLPAFAVAGTQRLGLTSRGGEAVELDGLALIAAGEAGTVRFAEVAWQHRPEIVAAPGQPRLLLKYADAAPWYGLAWDCAPWEVREFHAAELDSLLRATVHHHTRDQFFGTGEGHYTNVFCRPIVLEPGETRVLHEIVCAGERAAVERRLAAWETGAYDREACVAAARAGVPTLAPTPAGAAYRFSQERMAATLLTNVVYPVYTRRAFIRHNTPGRWWDSLYTWDSGFIGLGLAELDRDRARDCLRAYLTPPGDPDAAFIHYGSLVPTQHALFHELWNRAPGTDELLRETYPGLRGYWRFLSGRAGSSTTARFGSGLLQTWDYFYNSGGWDDYPPQVRVHERGLTGTIAPVIATAQTIRAAKILRAAARQLDCPADVAEYDEAIATHSAALQLHAWDEESGYFGYVVHDEAGEPRGILRHESGANFDRGLDGLYPLVAGCATPAQEARLLDHLTSQERHWTPIGLSTVDRTAPYYRTDGYWNGAVWMAHQWYFWKALLDLGRPDLARRLALIALDLWATEVGRTHRTFEHFISASGRGAGWHHFGGLSAPVLNWYGAYFRPGRLTVGFDAWLTALTIAPDRTALSATLLLDGSPHRAPALVATLAPGPRYRARWAGAAVPFSEPLPGVLEFVLPPGIAGGTLEIDSADCVAEDAPLLG